MHLKHLFGYFLGVLAVWFFITAMSNVFAGHVFDGGDPRLDTTLQMFSTSNPGAGSATIFKLYPAVDMARGRNSPRVNSPTTCQVDILTAWHVADNAPLTNGEAEFELIAKDERMDLAILRGTVAHPCNSLVAVSFKSTGVPFGTPIWTVGYPLGSRAYAEGFAGECNIMLNGLDWCMHSLSGGFGASGSGIYAGADLIGIVQRGVGEAGPYVMGVAPWHIQDFLDEVYD